MSHQVDLGIPACNSLWSLKTFLEEDFLSNPDTDDEMETWIEILNYLADEWRKDGWHPPYPSVASSGA